MEERIKIIENGIYVDTNELNKIIDEWGSFKLYKSAYRQGFRKEELYKIILESISTNANQIASKMRVNIQKVLNRPNDMLDWFDLYPKIDPRSIGFEVLFFLNDIRSKPIEALTIDDIPIIMEFISTPADKTLEAWDKWVKYWENLDYTARKEKLLEDLNPSFKFDGIVYPTFRAMFNAVLESKPDLKHFLGSFSEKIIVFCEKWYKGSFSKVVTKLEIWIVNFQTRVNNKIIDLEQRIKNWLIKKSNNEN